MNHAERVLDSLDDAVRRHAPVDQMPAVLFSGGLDSSIIARLLSRYSDPKLYTVGIEGSYDLRTGQEAAAFLGLPWEGIIVDARDLLEAVKELVRTIPTTNPVTLSFELPLHLVASRVREVELFTGQGADELFAGYARYLNMDAEERKRHMDSDLMRLLDKGISYEREIAKRHGKRVHHPYLDEKVVEAVRELSADSLIQGSMRKTVLREVAALLDLGDIITRPKKAAQYGSGIMKTLKRSAKERGVTLRALVRQLSESTLG